MTEDKATYVRKVKRAAKILFYRRHRQPGVKGWELRKSLGKDYLKIIGLLNQQLGPLGLRVKTVYRDVVKPKNPTKEQLENARFYMTINDPLAKTDLVMSGWRVDNVAALVVTIAYIISKQGKASRREVEQLLKEKFPKWRVERTLNRYIRLGYLNLVDDILSLDWRARTEIDQKLLIKLLIGGETGLSGNDVESRP